MKAKPELEEKAAKIIPILKSTYPKAKVALKYRNPFELLIATVLSAQCTDNPQGLG